MAAPDRRQVRPVPRRTILELGRPNSSGALVSVNGSPYLRSVVARAGARALGKPFLSATAAGTVGLPALQVFEWCRLAR